MRGLDRGARSRGRVGERLEDGLRPVEVAVLGAEARPGDRIGDEAQQLGGRGGETMRDGTPTAFCSSTALAIRSSASRLCARNR